MDTGTMTSPHLTRARGILKERVSFSASVEEETHTHSARAHTRTHRQGGRVIDGRGHGYTAPAVVRPGSHGHAATVGGLSLQGVPPTVGIPFRTIHVSGNPGVLAGHVTPRKSGVLTSLFAVLCVGGCMCAWQGRGARLCLSADLPSVMVIWRCLHVCVCVCAHARARVCVYSSEFPCVCLHVYMSVPTTEKRGVRGSKRRPSARRRPRRPHSRSVDPQMPYHAADRAVIRGLRATSRSRSRSRNKRGPSKLSKTGVVHR